MRMVSIILLWWSRTKELEKMAQECLNSVLKNTLYENYEVIIIENKPTVHNESKAIDAVYPSNFLKELNNDKVRIFTQDENLGFVRGNNLGFKLAGDNDVLLLNNDTQVPEGWLAPIVAVLDSHDDCAMAMPIQIHKGSSEYFELDGDIPKILEYLKNIIKRSDHVDKSEPMINGNWLPLCATLINRKALKKVGDLDENFALGGFEDIDYSWRCLDANTKLYVTSGSAIFHHYGQSFHYHEGYAEVWVDKGKYLMNKHDAKQDSKGNCYREKDKPEGWKPQ